MDFIFSRLRSKLAPSPFPATLLGVMLPLAVISALCAVVYGVSQNNGSAFLSNAGFICGMMASPVFILMGFVAAIAEKRLAPRAMLWALTAIFLLAGGFVTMVALSAAPEAGIVAGVVAYLLFCGIPAAFALIPAFYFGFKAWPELTGTLEQERDRRTLELLTVRGELAFAELAQELSLDYSECDDLLEKLLRDKRFSGWLDKERGIVLTTAEILKRQKQLTSMVAAHGQIHLHELARELHAPRELLRDWIYQMVSRGEFAGYINWNEGILYSAEARKLADATQCPKCGGELTMAGKGIIQCAHCGAEIFR